MKNEIFQYEGNAISFQSGDGSVMVNATQMARGSYVCVSRKKTRKKADRGLVVRYRF